MANKVAKESKFVSLQRCWLGDFWGGAMGIFLIKDYSALSINLSSNNENKTFGRQNDSNLHSCYDPETELKTGQPRFVLPLKICWFGRLEKKKNVI